jgi:hypothetical protein
MAAGNASFDALISTTLQHYVPKLVDNITRSTAFLDWLKRKDRITFASGRTIVEPLMYGLNTTFRTYSGYETLDLTPQEGITAAEYPWRQAAISVAISGIEEAKNSGKEAVLNLLKSKITQAEKTLGQEFAEMFFTSDGTGNSGKDWLGLAALVGDETDVATVGGIDCTDSANTWWRSNVTTSAGTITLLMLDDQYNDCSDGNDVPDFEVTTQVLYQKYQSLLQANQRFTDPKTGEAGFHNILHQGTPVVWDRFCPSGEWYFLNSSYLGLVGNKENWFKMRPFMTPEDKDAKYALFLAYGNFVTSNRRMQGALRGATV